MKPIIIVNFKTYKKATGENAEKLAEKLSKIAIKNKQKISKIIIAAQTADIARLKKIKGIQVYAQHVDYFEPDKHTGYITIEDVKAGRAKGTLLNHSEHPLPLPILKRTIKRCKQKDMRLIVCVRTIKQAKKIIKLKPQMIAFEIPELIASGKAISKQKPEPVKKFVKFIEVYNKKNKTKIIALCGAGISSYQDIQSAVKLGCKGVLIASAVVKAKNPEKILIKN